MTMDDLTRMACNIQAHILWVHRSICADELSAATVTDLLGAFIYLGTKHTWNQVFDDGKEPCAIKPRFIYIPRNP